MACVTSSYESPAAYSNGISAKRSSFIKQALRESPSLQNRVSCGSYGTRVMLLVIVVHVTVITTTYRMVINMHPIQKMTLQASLVIVLKTSHQSCDYSYTRSFPLDYRRPKHKLKYTEAALTHTVMRWPGLEKLLSALLTPTHQIVQSLVAQTLTSMGVNFPELTACRQYRI